MAERTRLFNIAASAPFLPTLIAALAQGRLIEGFPGSGDPLAWAQATIYLPTRRACRAAQLAFAEILNHDAVILPRIVAIGDIDEDEIVFSEMAAGALAADALSLPRAMEGFEHKAWLTQLVLSWAKSRRLQADGEHSLVAHSPAAAFALAGELARLQDDMITRAVDWGALDTLLPRDMDAYFEATLDFLKIARVAWPALLDERQAIDAADRRDRLIAAESARLQRDASGPVIAAGSTGSMPSTARLLAAIARLPHGAVVLPGLDSALDDKAWASIDGATDGRAAFGHPQFSMQALLRQLQVSREAVIELAPGGAHDRAPLLSEAMRPAESTDAWSARLADGDFIRSRTAALKDLAVIEAETPEEEALAIALALREAIDDGTADSARRTAALITPDRPLARRVLAALQRWNVPVDDSGGDALADTPAGIFARLVADVAIRGCEPVALLALLKHPLCRMGEHEFSHLRAVAALERAVLRGPRPRPGCDGLAQALQALRDDANDLHRSDPRLALAKSELNLAATLIATLRRAIEPLACVASPLPLREFCLRHHAAVAAVSRDRKDESAALIERDGDALRQTFEAIVASGSAADFDVSAGDYPELFHAIAADRVVRRPSQPGVRLRIYGPLEARLQQADRVVLGGLVEGVWPPEPRNDPWLNRPMRQDLGLDLPERRIGLSAHDFAQALGAKEAILAYPAKREGAPTVTSRFVQRLAAVAGASHWEEAKERGRKYRDWARQLDATGPAQPAPRPAPKPPLAARPQRLSVTEIEHWLRDPYTIYAKHVLRLIPLDAVDTPPGARDRGTVIHKAIGDFTQRYATALPDDPCAALLALGRAAFAPLSDYPEAQAFWWPRFERIARWFVDWESERRKMVSTIHAETDGRLQVAPDFELTARADRIELLADGRLAVLDYKTGQPPGQKEVAIGLAPQLTLQAAMLRQGGFAGIVGGASIGELVYLRLSGGEPAGKVCPIEFKNGSVDAKADEALTRLRELIDKFRDPECGYRSRTRPKWIGRVYGDYDHLARVKEWSANGGGEGDGE